MQDMEFEAIFTDLRFGELCLDGLLDFRVGHLPHAAGRRVGGGGVGEGAGLQPDRGEQKRQDS
jgi:hypothetical protein